MTKSMNAMELRYLTYSRGDLCDRTIDEEYLPQECPLDQISSETPSLSSLPNPTASLGLLELPPEIAQNILSNVDLGSLTLLRSVSRRLRILIDSVLPYQEILTHAPNALRALLSTSAARYFTVIDLQAALRSQGCFLCDRFGPFLYILECRRCCWQCLVSVQDLLPISKDAAQTLYHLDPPAMSSIPTIINIPGPYGPKQRRLPHMRAKGGVRVALVAYGAARKAGATCQALTDDYYEKAKLETRIAFRGPVHQDFMRDMDCMNYDPVGYKEGYGLEPQRFMAAVRFPSLNAGNVVEWGVSCLGCLEGAEVEEEERLWNEQYATEGVVEHLARCQKARRFWVDDRVLELKRISVD